MHDPCDRCDHSKSGHKSDSTVGLSLALSLALALQTGLLVVDGVEMKVAHAQMRWKWKEVQMWLNSRAIAVERVQLKVREGAKKLAPQV